MPQCACVFLDGVDIGGLGRPMLRHYGVCVVGVFGRQAKTGRILNVCGVNKGMKKCHATFEPRLSQSQS